MRKETKFIQYIFLYMRKISLKLKRFLKISKITKIYKIVHKAHLMLYTMYIIIPTQSTKKLALEDEKMKDQRLSSTIKCTYPYRIMDTACSHIVVRDIQRTYSSVRWSLWRIWSRTAGACHRRAERSCELSLTKTVGTLAFKMPLRSFLSTITQR